MRACGSPPRLSRPRLLLLTWLAALGGASDTAAQDASSAAKAAITERLNRWTANFNAKDQAGICGLFANDLSYTVDDVSSGSRDKLCGNISKALATPGLTLRYDEPAIHEILVSGDLAVVRLAWTLTAERDGARDVTTEEGMDVFRRDTEGMWSIARYIAFSTRPNTVLKTLDAPP